MSCKTSDEDTYLVEEESTCAIVVGDEVEDDGGEPTKDKFKGDFKINVYFVKVSEFFL